MPDTPPPRLVITINYWTHWFHPTAETSWSLDQRLAATKNAGFDAYCCPADEPNLKALLTQHGLRFGGAFSAGSIETMAPEIRAMLAIDNGPINCQLANHDTPIDEAVQLTIALMQEAEKQGALVHLETHRDTCTETPEKTRAIIAGVREATGKEPLVNFDFSHHAVVKHLSPDNYAPRLFTNIPLFQQSRLWHMRPFNGHHCQVPVTDGHGNFSPEYLEIRPMIREALSHWLAGPRPGNELWVMPELGPLGGYGLSCFPNIWEDAIVLGQDIRKLWSEETSS